MAWCFEDEHSAYADAVLDRLSDKEGLIPAIWPLEVANALLTAERKGRITPRDSDRFLDYLRHLPLSVDPETVHHAFGGILRYGRERKLSSYDAAYLELARRAKGVLCTIDRSLREAAGKAGVEVFMGG
jgi:predicted nucleic acid-binding protein